MALTRTSRYISLILRHKPETIGITLDEHGWASVDELIAGVSRTHPLTMESLEEIVRTDEKQRYSFNGDKTLIRANPWTWNCRNWNRRRSCTMERVKNTARP